MKQVHPDTDNFTATVYLIFLTWKTEDQTSREVDITFKFLTLSSPDFKNDFCPDDPFNIIFTYLS